MTWNRAWKKKKKEWQKGQDLWSHLASNSFTFCSLQLNIRGPNDQGLERGGRMSRLTPNPPAKPARLCRTLRPSFENKGEGSDTGQAAPVFLAGLQVLQGPLRVLYRTMTRLWHRAELFKTSAHWAVSTVHAEMWPGTKGLSSSSEHRDTSE